MKEREDLINILTYTCLISICLFEFKKKNLVFLNIFSGITSLPLRDSGKIYVHFTFSKFYL